jgi:glycosyltransferase involved in cell wall biosynthesis
LKKILAAKQYDAIWYNASTLSDVTLLELAKDSVPRRIVHSHNSQVMGNHMNALLHAMHKRSLSEFATDYFACSGVAADYMFGEHSEIRSKVHVIPNAVNLEKFAYDPEARRRVRDALGIGEEIVFGHSGAFRPQKNHDFLVDVFRAIKDCMPEARFLMLGDGALKSAITEKIDAFGLTGCVELIGNVPNVQDYLSAMDVFIFPSLYEGFPISLIEAESSGLPSVSASTITPDALLVPQAKQLSLDETPSAWAEAAVGLSKKTFDRRQASRDVRKAGYDIDEQGEALIALFRGMA